MTRNEPFFTIKSASSATSRRESPAGGHQTIRAVPFLPIPPQTPTFTYQSTIHQITNPISEPFHSNILKHPETENDNESGNEAYQRRLINLRNDLKWYDREFHAMRIGEGDAGSGTSRRLNEQRLQQVLSRLEELKETGRRYGAGTAYGTGNGSRAEWEREQHEKHMEALEALRAQEDKLRSEYKRFRHAQFMRGQGDQGARPRTAPAGKQQRKQEKWWEWATPEFTKRLHENRIDIATGRAPKVQPPLPSRSRIYAKHTQPWRPQYKCPQNFDSAPHPMFGQDYEPYKRKFAGEIAY